MKYLSVCSGIEAATVAWRPLGWRAAGFSEIEPFPSAVLAHHHPAVPNLGDMTNFREWPEEVFAQADMIVGGPPCQASINQRFNEKINCFYYAMPLEIYDKVKNEIPAFAGVITYNQRNKTASIIKKAKINRSAKSVSFEDKLKLARLLNFRYWNIVNKKQRVKNNACN